MASITNDIDENIFLDATGKESSEDGADDLELETPPPSPSDKKGERPGLFSLAQVSLKLNELWSSARERVFGEDYWIPSDPLDVAIFPQDILSTYKTIFPQTTPTHRTSRSPSLVVVQGTIRNEPAVVLNHVIYNYMLETNQRVTLTIFRSTDASEAIDFWRRCEECKVLLRLLDKRKDIRKSIRDITNKFQQHPLWRMVHIAIACSRTDVFTDDGLNYLKSIGYSVEDLTKTVSSPEGQTPLMYAIETNQISIAKFLLKIGADPAARDLVGNNALHYAALASVQMLEAVFEVESAKPLLNLMNNDGYTPALLAIRNANPRILATLLSFGAELNYRASGGRNPLFEALQSKGKSVEVIRTILDASPNLLTAVDEATGNTALHAALFKTSLMSLLYLKAKEMDLNAKNKAGQTALHLYTIRGDLGMAMTIASYRCDLNIPNHNGNTALHLAVSKRYLLLTRVLLCLGADPNVVNVHGDSPRHLAAKLSEHNLLKSLIICGAKRCPPTKSGCVSGCVNEKSIQLLSRNPSSLDFNSPRTITLVEEIENRTFAQAEKEYRYNKINDAEHNEIYDEMMKLLDSLYENGDGNTNIVNVLTLDGGGIRGLVICQTLLEVEKIMGEPIFPYFDWTAGTSTGALVGTSLALGLNLRDIQMVYLRFKDLIFEGWSRPYNSAILESFIQSELGASTLLSEVKWPRMMYTITRADCFPVQLEFVRNYRLPLTVSENEELGFTDPSEITVWKAMRRTSAAPTYFSCVDNKYIDGGIMSNNPTLDLFAEIQLWNSVNKYKRLPNKVKVGCVLSLGTGVIPTLPMDPNTLEITGNPYSLAMAIKNLGTILVDQVTATEGAPINRAASWCINQQTPYFRLSAPLFKEVPMDTKDDVDLARMMWDCMEYTYKHRDYIEKCCALLKRVGKSWKRRHLFQSYDATHVDMQTQTSAPASPAKSQEPED